MKMAREEDLRVEDVLHLCLARVLSGEETVEAALAAYPRLDAELRPLLETALWMQARTESLEARPGYLAAGRRRLVEQIGAERRRPAFGWRQELAWLFQNKLSAVTLTILLGLALFFTFSAGRSVALGAAVALPGEVLYPLKPAMEELLLALSLTDEGDAQLYIEFSARRLDEIGQLVLEGKTDGAKDAVRRFEWQIVPALQLANKIAHKDPRKATELIGLIDRTLTNQTLGLSVLSGLAPTPEMRSDVRQALATSSLSVEIARALSGTLEPPGPTSTPAAEKSSTPTPAKVP